MTKQQQKMRAFWNRKARENASFYIATWRGYNRRDLNEFFLSADEAREFLRVANYVPRPDHRMLEIGCGIGRMTSGFAQLVSEVYGIDVSEQMIERAKTHLTHLPNVHLNVNDGTSLAHFEDEFFDFCFSYIVFQHIPDKDVTLYYIREAARVLKVGGIFRFQVNGLPDPDKGSSRRLLMVKKVYRRYVRYPAKYFLNVVRRAPRGFESEAWGGSYLTQQEVMRTTEDAGLQILEVSGQGTRYMWFTCQKISLVARESHAHRGNE